MRKLLRRLEQWKRHRELHDDLTEELEFHRRMREQDLLESGASPGDARAKSYRIMGNTTRSLEDARSVWIWPWLESLLQDATYAVRAFRRSPIFMGVLVLMLAIGSGANTALFSVIDAVMFRVPGVSNPEELVFLNWKSSGWKPRGGAVATVWEPGYATSPSFSQSAYQKLGSSTHTLSDLAAYGSGVSPNVVEFERRTLPVTTQPISGNYFQALGLSVFTGRRIDARDDTQAADPAVVLTHRGWKNRFGLDPAVVGKQIRFPNSDTVATIVGVMPEAFQGMGGLNNYPDVLVPFSIASRIEPPVTQVSDPVLWQFRVVGRKKSGFQLEDVRNELQKVFEQAALDESEGGIRPEIKLEVLSGHHGDPMPSWYRASGNDDLLKTMVPMPAFLLVIVCLNVANLLIARAAARRNEIGVRLALGAARLRIVRQLLTESAIIAVFGGVAGLVLAYFGRNLFGFFLRDDIDLLRIDSHVLGFTATVAVLSGLLFGLAPSFHATRASIHSALKKPEGWGSRSRLTKGLLIAQVALSLVLVASGSLLFRTVQEFTSSRDAALDSGNLIIWEAPVTNTWDRIGAIAGISTTTGWRLAGPGGRGLAVEPNFFSVMGIPLVAGRGFREDEKGQAGIAIVDEEMVRRYFRNRDPIGQEIPAQEVPGSRITIIGVAQDTTLTPPPHKFGYKPRNTPRYYVAGLAPDNGRVTLGIRTSVDPSSVISAIRAAETGSDSSAVPETYAQYRERVFARSFSLERSLGLALNIIGTLALALVSAGLYGVIAYSVSRRTKEMGIRMAMGAPPQSITWIVQKEMMPILAIGLPIGLVMSLPVMILIRREVFGLAPRDLPSLLLALLLVGSVTAFAAWLPARRASRINPATALNHEMS